MNRNRLHSSFLGAGKVLALITISGLSSAYVYIGGWGAKLPATPEEPVITFYWNGDAPEYTGREEFEGGIYQDLSDAELTEVIFKEAMSQWNSVRGSYLIFDLQNGPAPLDKTDLTNTIPFTYTCARTQATHPSFSDDLKYINDCDIEICENKVDAHLFMQSMTHELGHCAGLGHPNSNYEAIMSYSNNGKVDRLGLDDIAGLASLYPDPAFGSTEHKEIVACGAIQAGAREFPAFLTYLLLGLPLIYPLFLRLVHPRKRTHQVAH